MTVRLLQLASPMLPIGAFSYSSGLESAIEAGSVFDAESGANWVGDVMEWGLARQDAALVAAAFLTWDVWQQAARGGCKAAEIGALESLKNLNDLAFAARETAELRLECTQTGHSLAVWIERTLDPAAIVLDALAALAPLSYPVAWAVAGSHLALSARDTVIGLLWGFVENQAGALMKALPMGQTAAQRMLLALGPRVEATADLAMRRASCAATDPHPWGVAERCAAEGAGSGGIAGAMPGLAIASMLHETQYSRLFRS